MSVPELLLLAPQPFYQERGTPIAVDRLARTIGEYGVRVRIVAYPEGEEVARAGVTIDRVEAAGWISGVPPGFSWKKVLCDAFMLAKVLRTAGRGGVPLVWAVEEAAFIALALKWLYGIPYVYDMDSSMAQQLVEKHDFLAPLRRPFERFERLAIRNAAAVVPVCEALRRVAEGNGAREVVVLHDYAAATGAPQGETEDLRRTLGTEAPLVLYVGNLEGYQGIDLLLESFVLLVEGGSDARLVLLGGTPEDVERYTAHAERLGLADRAHLLGPRPLDRLQAYLEQADILVSPRILGGNTPMKLYAYLESGTPVLATDLDTHTQVVDQRHALLAAPRPEPFAAGLSRLLDDAELRARLGHAGRALVREHYSESAYRKKLGQLLGRLAERTDLAFAGPRS